MPHPPRRVLYLDHTAVLAGGEIALLNLVTHLDRDRYTPIVALLADGPLAKKLADEKIETHLIPAHRGLLEAKKDSLSGKSFLKFGAVAGAANSVFRISRLIRQLKPNLVQANSLKSNLLGGVAARQAGVPIIWHIRDRIADDYLSPPATKLVRTLAGVLPSHVVANSQATLSTVQLANPSKGSVIYSGLDLTACLQTPIPPPRTEPIASPLIGIVGRLANWKGQHIFLEAAALVKQKFPAARFQIVGGPLFNETDYEKHLHALAASLGLTTSSQRGRESLTTEPPAKTPGPFELPAVDFTGHRDDVPALIAAMDILVHASITGEPFGQVIILGLASGKPVIATNGGGVPEIITPNQTGLLVPMNDAPSLAEAICQILSNPTLADQLARAGRQRAIDHFTIQRTASQMMDLYDRIAAN